MKILYIIPYVPSLVRVRSYQIIRNIKAMGHHVTLATITTSLQEEEELNHFRKYCDNVISANLSTFKSLLNCIYALPSDLPLQSVYSWDEKFYSSINNQLWDNRNQSMFDIIHIEHLRGSQYGVRLTEKNSSSLEQSLPPIIWDSVDCISYLFRQAAKQSKQGLKRIITHFDQKRTERQESLLTHLFDSVLVTSEKDKNALISLANNNSQNIKVVPNGVDLDYFQSGNFINREEATLVISGKMSYHANVNMVLFLAERIMPIVWNLRPDVKLWIVGKDPTAKISELENLPNVTVTGTVDSMLPYLQKATIAVAPIQYGAGIQNKVLEAMACATPVIASSLAVSALAIESGRELLVEDSVDEWVSAILELIASPEKRKNLGTSGRRYVEKNHQWQKIAHNIEDIYFETISKHTRSSQVFT